MRVITWNLRRAGESHPAWDKLKEIDPDVALLQDIGEVPDWVTRGFNIIKRQAVTKQGRKQDFSTAVLVKGRILKEISLHSNHSWVNPILEFFIGNFIGCIVQPQAFAYPIHVISVYSPAWSIQDIEKSAMKSWLHGVDLSSIKLKENPYLWPTEIIWFALSEMDYKDKFWIVGGDYNSSPRFDERKVDGSLFARSYRGTKEVLDRMINLGFVECLFGYNQKSIPTFKNARSQRVEDQLDHLFVTSNLYAVLQRCYVGGNEILEMNMSDHLPIIADFAP